MSGFEPGAYKETIKSPTPEETAVFNKFFSARKPGDSAADRSPLQHVFVIVNAFPDSQPVSADVHVSLHQES